MQRIQTLALSTLIVFVTIVSCSKQGPAGATGPAGPTGPAGATGPAGPAGNVVYSQWTSGFSGTSSDWQVPAITQGVLDSSAVLVYFQEGTIVRQLPYDLADGSGFYVNDDLAVGEIELSCSSNQDLSQFSFRYVILPPGVAATEVARSYQEMTARLGITP